jgi:arylsulfatase A-like enzyme
VECPSASPGEVIKALPPFRFFYSSALILTFFFLFEYFLFMFWELYQNVPFGQFLKNIVFMAASAGVASIPLAGALWLLELSAGLVSREARPGRAPLSAFVLAISAAYIFWQFLKFDILELLYMKSTPLQLYAVKVLTVSAFGLSAIAAAKNAGRINGWLIRVSNRIFFPSLVLVFAFVIAGGIIFRADSTPPASPPLFTPGTGQGRPNVILLTFDSLTSRHMSVNGYSRKTTPNLDAFAGESCFFPNMRANSNSTWYCLNSILGFYPRPFPLDVPAARTFVSALKDAGYNQRHYVSYLHLSTRFDPGFTSQVQIKRFDASPLAPVIFRGQNWDSFLWLRHLASEDYRLLSLSSVDHPRDFCLASASTYPLPAYFDHARKLLKERDGPVFIWVHFFEPHFPYDSPPPFRDSFGNSLTGRYDSSILYMDYHFGQFIKWLKRENLYDSSLVIVSSDHGEANSESSVFVHGGPILSGDLIDVPLIVHLPGQKKGRKPRTPACQVDIGPTILDVIGAEIPPWLEGESLLPYMNDERRFSSRTRLIVPASYFVRERDDLGRLPEGWPAGNVDVLNVYCGRYKAGVVMKYDPGGRGGHRVNRLREMRVSSLYDLSADPGEKRNLSAPPVDPGVKSFIDGLERDPLVLFYRDRKPWSGGR